MPMSGKSLPDVATIVDRSPGGCGPMKFLSSAGESCRLPG